MIDEIVPVDKGIPKTLPRISLMRFILTAPTVLKAVIMERRFFPYFSGALISFAARYTRR